MHARCHYTVGRVYAGIPDARRTGDLDGCARQSPGCGFGFGRNFSRRAIVLSTAF